VQPKEDLNCYASPAQRDVLIRLADLSSIRDNFFLTGGTALSVFYLHHRTSEDLDLFSCESVDLAEIQFSIRTTWQSGQTLIRSTSQFLSLLIENVKVDIVVDPLSDRSTRDRIQVGSSQVLIDSLGNIGANKFCTLVSRTEPKDFIDFFFLLREFPELTSQSLFEAARKREALFDDPPTAAFQLETGLHMLRDHESLIPRMIQPIDLQELTRFYEALAKYLYWRQR
jgi:hypothetical protein